MNFKNYFNIDVTTSPPGNWRLTINGKVLRTYCINQLYSWAKDAGINGCKEEIYNLIINETVSNMDSFTQNSGVIEINDIPIFDKNIYIMLGRTGDIISLLPALKYESERLNEKIKLVCSSEFIGVVDGCSYIEPIVWNGDFKKPANAINWIKKTYPEYRVINCSVCAEDMKIEKDGWSFNRDIWIKSKIQTPPYSHELLFDNRNKLREKELLKKYNIPKDKKIITLAMSGISSPFKDASILKQELEQRCNDFLFIDISNIKAERIYDIIAIFEMSSAIIATDSAPLHLSNAVKIPVIALVEDGNTNWHQSSWNKNHTLRIPYSKAIEKIEDIIKVINGTHKKPNLIYVKSSADVNGRDEERIKIANKSLILENNLSGGMWIKCKFNPKRNATSIGDKPLPFIRDMLDQANEMANPKDIIVILNADIGVVPGITGEILDACQLHGACYAQRMDFKKIQRTIINEKEASIGDKYCGVDLFAMTKEWWNTFGKSFPDMLLGREAWDMIMRYIVKINGGKELFSAIYHERHGSYWYSNIKCNGNEYNRELAREWLKLNNKKWE